MAEIIQHFKKKVDCAVYCMSGKLNKEGFCFFFLMHLEMGVGDTEMERQQKETGKG